MKDEVQAPQEKTPNTYWRWLVESWRYPLGHNLGEKWYGVVTLLGDSKDKDPIPVNLDGEIGGHLPIDFENLKQHIEFYVG